MTCTKIQNGFLCGGPDYENYICFESTTYILEFSRMFGPTFYRLECGKEIEVEFDSNEDDTDIISNTFLWDIFEEMQESGVI